jgi:hypothetical protein
VNWNREAGERTEDTGMGTSDAQKSEVHETTDDASTAPSSRAGQGSGDAKKDVDRDPDEEQHRVGQGASQGDEVSDPPRIPEKPLFAPGGCPKFAEILEVTFVRAERCAGH